ncbi:uncharacterized protein CTRU02_205899 [Colletotrichum truncatum]|uniref:Uncharacterized protein n=1 Tax=Colletotrichum truncatum TaxID=5467 RepID=A0ACC3Z5C0_COLTU|nr:uncharacterized protein CTRU02_04732 [Colletotrichum truncatum]KAF6795169.1 hypothetical protein CTRU02_04732 [Colletotrichum truncatum]
MWCTNLRKRPEWAPAIRAFPDSAVRLKEGRLESHDVAIATSKPGRMLRLLLISLGDLGIKATIERLDRLSRLQGGQDVAIVFLDDSAGRQKMPMEAFMKLQIMIFDKSELPVIPLHSAFDLTTTLQALQPPNPMTQLAASPASLLQHMAGSGPLSKPVADLLSELGRSPSEVAALASTEEGRTKILDRLGHMDGERVLLFLKLEKLVITW